MPSKKKPKAGGIYKIWFGKKYYIGRSRWLANRIKGHENYLYKRLNGLVDAAEIHEELDYYKFIMAHVTRNKSMKTALAEVVEYCDSDYFLWKKENKHLRLAKGDPNCLNVGFEAKPYAKPRTGGEYPVLELRPWMVKKIVIKRAAKLVVKKEKKEQKEKEKNKYAGLSGRQKLDALKAEVARIEAEYGKNR